MNWNFLLGAVATSKRQYIDLFAIFQMQFYNWYFGKLFQVTVIIGNFKQFHSREPTLK